MRRKLVLLILATTLLVVISLIIPLALLVRQQAADQAKVMAETNAQQVAGVVAVALAVTQQPDAIAEAVGSLPAGTVVVLEDGRVVGDAHPGQGSLASSVIESGATPATEVAGGWEVAIPVIGPATRVVVDTFVSNDELQDGVYGAWALLAGLGVLLIGTAVLVADRMGRGLVEPIEELAVSARRLADGDLDARVVPTDPDELREVGKAFNYLAGRLDALLVEERESVADISHRLRTPLTSLRLQAESLADPDERSKTLDQVDRLERAVDQTIELTRSPGATQPGRAILDEIVGTRLAFWQVLADDQSRALTVHLNASDMSVPVSSIDLAAVVDVLVENVFSHTPAGSTFDISTGVSHGFPWLEVADRGPGFDSVALDRGVSGGGSTGLGLDIVRKTVKELDVNDRPDGGAVVRVGFG